MTGKHDLLANLATKSIADDHQKNVLRDYLEFLLASQYVTTEGYCDGTGHKKVFSVVKGSGMGLIMSGDIADLALHHTLEKDFVFSPHENVEVVSYLRYKDDILMILRGERQNQLSFV